MLLLQFIYSVPSLKTPNKHCQIVNKGNTCYANVILQCLKIFPVLWSSNDQIKSTLYSSVRKIMFQLHSAKSPIDPSFFLKSLKDAFIREGRSSFNLHAQQDVVEVSEILLEELTGPSIIISAAYNIKSLTSTICNTCHQLNGTEDIHPAYTLSSCPKRFSNLACESFRNRIFDWVKCSILQYLLRYKRNCFQALFKECWKFFNSTT